MKKNLSGGFLWLLCMGSALSCSLSQAREKQADETRSNNGKRVTVAFDFKRGGIASSQYAIWIENEKGELVRTLYATSFTARGGYSYREDALPLWVEKARPSNMDASQVDAVTGTTPQNGPLAYTWDGTDSRGNAVPAGNYRLFVEGTLYWKSRVLYT
ncbi:MAG: DUF2271 domain-containing protein, partial [Paraprevotella sp.]|nr:DUF2271 domain-containing protein [Paraprevotella sp.]